MSHKGGARTRALWPTRTVFSGAGAGAGSTNLELLHGRSYGGLVEWVLMIKYVTCCRIDVLQVDGDALEDLRMPYYSKCLNSIKSYLCYFYGITLAKTFDWTTALPLHTVSH